MNPMNSEEPRIFYEFMPNPAERQLVQVCQGNPFATNTHHEFEPSENLANLPDGMSLELNLGGGFDHWAIKRLMLSDVNVKASRLLLPKDLVQKNILTQWDARCIANIKNGGVRVAVWDCNTGSEHQLLFKQWANGSYVLIENWIKEFVRRRDLRDGDEIGLFWDQSNSRFYFSHFT